MIIKEFSIKHKHDEEGKTYTFGDLFNLFYSKENAAGKTTFLRSVLYSLGFCVPSTKQVDFSKYEFFLKIEYPDGTVKSVRRLGDAVWVDDCVFSYPNDCNLVIANLFGTDNGELVNNILGAIYIDQEKGWTLLNRGKIIGENSFNIESFLRGLNGNDETERLKKSSEIKNEIKKYRLLRDVAEYRNSVERLQNPISVADYNENAIRELAVIDNKIKNIDQKIKETQAAKRDNEKFARYVASMGIRVKIGDTIHYVSEEDLDGFKDYSNLATIEIDDLTYKKNELIKRKKELELTIKTEPIVDVKTVLEQFDAAIDSFAYDDIQIQRIIQQLEGDKARLDDEIKTRTKANNPFIEKIGNNIKKYWKELDIENPYTDNYLFTHDLKSLSGAILYKMIIAYKFAYILALQEKLGELLPIFIDSPAGREVKEDTISTVMKILARDFKENQVFLCSIYKFENALPHDKLKMLVFGESMERPFDRTISLV